MSYRVIVAPAAEQQLDADADWWAEHRSGDEAGRWYSGFRENIARLAENPHIHGLADEDEDFPCELRQLLFGLGSRPTHRALFTIAGGVVTVLAIRHIAQDRVTPADVAYPADES